MRDYQNGSIDGDRSTERVTGVTPGTYFRTALELRNAERETMRTKAQTETNERCENCGNVLDNPDEIMAVKPRNHAVMVCSSCLPEPPEEWL